MAFGNAHGHLLVVTASAMQYTASFTEAGRRPVVQWLLARMLKSFEYHVLSGIRDGDELITSQEESKQSSLHGRMLARADDMATIPCHCATTRVTHGCLE